jgi:hypothetical protein
LPIFSARLHVASSRPTASVPTDSPRNPSRGRPDRIVPPLSTGGVADPFARGILPPVRTAGRRPGGCLMGCSSRGVGWSNAAHERRRQMAKRRSMRRVLCRATSRISDERSACLDVHVKRGAVIESSAVQVLAQREVTSTLCGTTQDSCRATRGPPAPTSIGRWSAIAQAHTGPSARDRSIRPVDCRVFWSVIPIVCR